jgi:predicted DsbA family dithiol-disulfide isomerase
VSPTSRRRRGDPTLDDALHTVGTTVDVVSDVVCPWCYIGKRHLEAALATLVDDGKPAPVVRWHPFELNPGLPREGIDRRDYVESKFGGPARAAQVYERVRRAGTQAGIAFDFEAIRRQPNTRDAHRLIAWAQSREGADALVERLFRAYFIEGRFVGSHEVLAEIAHEAGEDADAAYAFLGSGVGASECIIFLSLSSLYLSFRSLYSIFVSSTC